MSRWSDCVWAIAATVIDENGDIYPLSELESRRGLVACGYYEEPYLFRSEYFEMKDVVGEYGGRNEGFFNINATLRITDTAGGENILKASAEGYVCCDEDCFMLFIITPGKDAASCELEAQIVDVAEFREAVGEAAYNDYLHGNAIPKLQEAPLF